MTTPSCQQQAQEAAALAAQLAETLQQQAADLTLEAGTRFRSHLARDLRRQASARLLEAADTLAEVIDPET